MPEDFAPQSMYLSPVDLIKNKCVSLLFQCIDLNSQSMDPKDKYAFCRKVFDLSVLLEKFATEKVRIETQNWYKQQNEEVSKIMTMYTSKTKERLNEESLDITFRYATETHSQNTRILMNSPIFEVDAEGDFVLTPEALEIIRGEGVRKDDGKLVFKS